MKDRLSAERSRIRLVLVTLLVLFAMVATLTIWSVAYVALGSRGEPSAGAVAESSSSTQVAWPAEGEAAFAIGDGQISASSEHPLPMASISKVVTALIILEARPLNPGDAGGNYRITAEDEIAYQDALRAGESTLTVTEGAMFTQRELLEGMLIASACNYADFLVKRLWGTNEAFVDAAKAFFARHNLTGITMVEPTGIDARNTATPAALVEVGRLALANPVIAEIVVMREVTLPVVGTVENTNDLLNDQGSLGIKTGTLGSYNLLSAKRFEADGAAVPVVVVVMGQPSDKVRYSSARHIYDQIANGAR